MMLKAAEATRRSGTPNFPGKVSSRKGRTPVFTTLDVTRPGPVGTPTPGREYYVPEDVPDSIAAQGDIAPGSVTEAADERK